MPVLPTASTALVSFVGTIFGQTTINTFLYRASAITGTPEVDAACEALFNALTDEDDLLDKYLECLPSNYQMRAMWLQVILPTRFRALQVPVTDVGTGPGTFRTANMQATISRFGPFANRKNQGGIRIPLGQEDINVEEGQISGDLKPLLAELALQMTQQVTTTGTIVEWQPQVGMPSTGNEPIRLAITVVQDTARVMRRRTVGRGI